MHGQKNIKKICMLSSPPSMRNDLTYLTFLYLMTITDIYCTAQIIKSRSAEFVSSCVNSFPSVQ